MQDFSIHRAQAFSWREEKSKIIDKHTGKNLIIMHATPNARKRKILKPQSKLQGLHTHFFPLSVQWLNCFKSLFKSVLFIY